MNVTNIFNKKNLPLIIAAAIILAVIVGGGIYYFSTKGGVVIKGETYRNEQYGFKMTFPDSWKGYVITEDIWKGWPTTTESGFQDEYEGVKLIFQNPKWTPKENWQNIPIMVFTPDVWKLVVEEKLRVSSVPILPEKVGENKDFVFATPPRWTFDVDFGVEEAIAIVKTLKGFKVTLAE